MLARTRISTSADFTAVSKADLVIEAVFENLAVKQEVFRKLDAVCKPGTVLATNTSTLDVDAIADATKRPESVLGMHFFSPANIMRPRRSRAGRGDVGGNARRPRSA